jgi:hypothetical protein
MRTHAYVFPASGAAPLGLRLRRSLPRLFPQAWFSLQVSAFRFQVSGFKFWFDGTLLPQSGAALSGLFAALAVYYLSIRPDQTSFVPLDSGLLGPPASND